MTPSVDLRSNLVFNAPDLRPQHVMIGGEWIVQDYQLKTMDLAQINERSAGANTKDSCCISENFCRPAPPAARVYRRVAHETFGCRKKKFYDDVALVAKKYGFEPYVPHHVTDPVINPDFTPRGCFEINLDQLTRADILISLCGRAKFGYGHGNYVCMAAGNAGDFTV